MTEKIEQLALRLAHRRATQYKHTASMGLPKFLFSEEHLLDFVLAIRDELAKQQEPVARVLDGNPRAWDACIIGRVPPGTLLYAHPAIPLPASAEPFGYFRATPFGWEDCAETDEGWKLVPVEPTPEILKAAYGHHYRLDTQLGRQEAEWSYKAGIAAAPTPPETVNDYLTVADPTAQAQDRGEVRKNAVQWINPNDKTQERYLPNIGEKVLFCHGGKTYIGKHTGGSFKSMIPPFGNFVTWDCFWMYPPSAMAAGEPRHG